MTTDEQTGGGEISCRVVVGGRERCLVEIRACRTPELSFQSG